AGRMAGWRGGWPAGLGGPRGCRRRSAAATGGAWVVAEKILAGDEELPPDWPCAGTTGYDALAAVGGLFVDQAGARPMTDAYVRATGGPAPLMAPGPGAKRENPPPPFPAPGAPLGRVPP